MTSRSGARGVPQSSTRISRRQLLGPSAPILPSGTQRASAQAGLDAQLGGPAARELFIAKHATQGFQRETLLEIRNFPGGAQAWIQNQLGLAGTLDDSVLDGILNDGIYDDLRRTAHELFLIYGGPTPSGNIDHLVNLVQGVQALRSIRSKCQLKERLIEFWTDHFNVWINKDAATKLFKSIEDRDVMRPLALGKFSDLLRASAQSPAMSRYLSGDKNTALAPNENYGREVMELHTLSVDVVYQEIDVVNAAKLFTGWGYVEDTANPQLGEFLFRPENHSVENPITVLGVNYTNGDVTDGENFLDDLAARPETAEFICAKLIRWLLGNPLPTHLHDQVVSEFISTGGDIALTVAKIFSNLIVDSAIPAGPVFKRPSRIVVGMMRQLQADLGPLGIGALGAAQGLGGLGQSPYDWPAPTGFPISIEAWGSDIYGRWTFVNGFVLGQLAPLGATVPDGLIDDLLSAGTDPLVLGKNIEQALMGSPFDPSDSAELQAYIETVFSNFPGVSQALQRVLTRDTLVFAASLPSYQFE